MSKISVLLDRIHPTIWIYISYSIFHLIIQYFTAIFIGIELSLYDWINKWDGISYLKIAESGYVSPELTVFFPLFPILISIFGKILFGNYELATLLLVNLFCYLSILFLYQFTITNFNKPLAVKSCITMLCFPTSFLLRTGHPESLLLCLILLASLHSTISVGIITSMLLSITKPYGILFTTLAFTKNSLSGLNKLILLITAITSISLYSLYLYQQVDTPLAFIQNQSHWNSLHGKFTITNPIQTIASNSNRALDLTILIICLAFILPLYKKINPYLYVVCILLIFLYPTLGRLASTSRHLLILFPVYISISLYLKGKFWLIANLAFLCLQTFLIYFYFQNYFIA